MSTTGIEAETGGEASKTSENYTGLFDRWDIVSDTAVNSPRRTGCVFGLEKGINEISVYESERQSYRVAHLKHESGKFNLYNLREEVWADSRVEALEEVDRTLQNIL